MTLKHFQTYYHILCIFSKKPKYSFKKILSVLLLTSFLSFTYEHGYETPVNDHEQTYMSSLKIRNNRIVMFFYVIKNLIVWSIRSISKCFAKSCWRQFTVLVHFLKEGSYQFSLSFRPTKLFRFKYITQLWWKYL